MSLRAFLLGHFPEEVSRHRCPGLDVHDFAEGMLDAKAKARAPKQEI